MELNEKHIRKIIREELGIAREVSMITKGLELLVNEFLSKPINYFELQIMNKLKVELQKKHYNSYQEYLDDPEKGINGYVFDDGILYLTFNYFQGKLLEDVQREATIQHEIEHFWQLTHANKNFATIKYKNSLELSHSQNPIEHYVGYLFYISHGFEIDALINGAYNSAKQHINMINTFNDFKKYSTYKNLIDDIRIIHYEIANFDYNNPFTAKTLSKIGQLPLN